MQMLDEAISKSQETISPKLRATRSLWCMRNAASERPTSQNMRWGCRPTTFRSTRQTWQLGRWRATLWIWRRTPTASSKPWNCNSPIEALSAKKSEQNNVENLEKLAAQIQGKFQASEDFVLACLESAIEKNFNDTVLGQQLIEMVAQQLQGQGADIEVASMLRNLQIWPRRSVS